MFFEEEYDFVIEEPEDEFALEELTFGPLSKCRRFGEGKRDKFKMPEAKQD